MNRPTERVPQVVVVGSVNVDFVARGGSLPSPGETVLANTFDRNLGGKGANQAVAAARFGAQVTFVGAVGDDAYGAEALRGLEDAGVDTRFVTGVVGTPTGIALICVDDSGRNMITVIPGANSTVSPAVASSIRNLFHPGVVVALQMEVPFNTVQAVVRAAKEQGATVVLNPSPARRLPLDVLAHVDVMVPNALELTCLLDSQPDDDVERAAQMLISGGVGAVVVTLGAEGAVLVRACGLVRVPGHRVEAVDTTGAGDTFVGMLACRLAEGHSLEEAVRYGNAAGALCVERTGAQRSIPSREMVTEFVERDHAALLH